jgi:hypothetical protein
MVSGTSTVSRVGQGMGKGAAIMDGIAKFLQKFTMNKNSGRTTGLDDHQM